MSVFSNAKAHLLPKRYKLMTQSIGIVAATFAPLTQADLQKINQLVGMVDTLHLLVLPNSAQNAPSVQDVARWLGVSYAGFDFIKIHTASSLNLPSDATAKQMIDGVQAGLTQTAQVFDLPNSQPAQFADLALACRYFYAHKIAIVGGESSGKTTLIGKLANHFGTAITPEMGRLYTHSHLGGTEIGLQYSDYPMIANNHADAIFRACHHSPSPVVLIDTDFVTTQAFCQTYEKQTHPMLDAFIAQFHPQSTDPHRIMQTIYLDNNVAWVADGMRRLGHERSAFAQRLLDLYAQHQIPLHQINHHDYHERYLQAVKIIENIIAKPLWATN